MKKYIYIMLAVVLAGIFASCSKDAPFDSADARGYGQLLTASLDVSLGNTQGPRSLRHKGVRAAVPSVRDFTVEFYLDGSDTPEVSYKYSDMPEIITLPVGNYRAVASYGSNSPAAWDEPYYAGETTFEIIADEITDKVDPIECSLSNVRVSIDFEQSLRDKMAAGASVTVKVGKGDNDPEAGILVFTTDDIEQDRSGFFAYADGSTTLAATFNGIVDGSQSVMTKSYTNVKPGMHYMITFKLRDAANEDPGFINPGGDGFVNVDSSIEEENMNRDVDSSEDGINDDMRPQEGEPTPDQPGGDEPSDPASPAPEITVESPATLDGVNELEVVEKDGENVSAYPIVLKIFSHADAGITTFKVKIDSNTLTPSELESVNLTDELDLVNPGKYAPDLINLGFEVNVGGKKEVTLEITKFVPLLCVLGEGTHNFIITVGDANGTTTRTLKLHNNEL